MIDGTTNGGVGREPPPQTAEMIVLRSALVHYQPTEDGGMELVFTPAVPLPGGFQFAGAQVRVPFDADGWERFKRDVANDGRVARVAIARELPPEPPAR